MLRQNEFLRDAKIRAENANFTKSEFLAVMSHEIRTPLTELLRVMHLLKRTSLDKSQERYVDTASSSGNMLLAIINDVLNYSSIEAGKLSIETTTFELLKVIEGVVCILSLEAETKGVGFVCDIDPNIPFRVVGDPIRLRQVLNNLANNAIKFTDESVIREFDFNVDQSVELPSLHGSDLVIIDQVESEAAVEEFIRFLKEDSDWKKIRVVHLVPRDSSIEGGLADIRLCKPVTQFHFFEALTIILNPLPISTEPSVGPVLAADSSGQVLAGRRILLVEDNEINQMLVLEFLTNTGAEIDIVVNGARAVEQVQQLTYDLVLMDIQMPVVDGLEATREIRNLGREYENLPIVAMTALTLKGGSALTEEAGMNHYLTKPFHPENFTDVLVQLINQTVVKT